MGCRGEYLTVLSFGGSPEVQKSLPWTELHMHAHARRLAHLYLYVHMIHPYRIHIHKSSRSFSD